MITKKQIQKYENIRSSGITNMFDVNTVIKHSNGLLTKNSCIEIMKKYSNLIEKHNIKCE